MSTITPPRPNLALSAARASLSCAKLFIAMHKAKGGCADCGYGYQSCITARRARRDAERLTKRIAALEPQWHPPSSRARS